MATHRIYYDDSFARDFTAEVLNCEPCVHGTTPAFEVILDSTALYPTSGGQPHDGGKLGDANVLEVRDEGEEIVHIVDRELSPGTVHGCVDWPRRFDHMQQHTGQHLLSAMFQERFGRPTVSFHLGSELSSIDLRGAEPTDEILEGAERAANRVIFEDRPINVRYGTQEELSQMGVRKEVERTGILRAIEIEGADLQPCGGTHVRRTAQIGLMLVRRCTKIRQDWRVEFACGARAERLARRDFRVLLKTAERLGCAMEEVADAAARAVAERDANFKDSRGLLQRLAELEAAMALQSLPPQSTAHGASGPRVLVRAFDETTQPDYIGNFASQLAKSENTIAIVGLKGNGNVVFAQHATAGNDMNALLKRLFEKFAGKGGGNRDFARGRINDGAQAEQALAFAKSILEEQSQASAV
jgi:alanyl-tRNA synthetase